MQAVSPRSIGLPHTFPKPRQLREQNQLVILGHSQISLPVGLDASRAVVKSSYPRDVERSSRTIWKISGEQNTCDALRYRSLSCTYRPRRSCSCSLRRSVEHTSIPSVAY